MIRLVESHEHTRPQAALAPGQHVQVVQTIETRDGPWQTRVEGRVVSCEPSPTGSWFAHGKHDRLWLQRLRLQRDDGEIIDLVIDHRSRVVSQAP